jgi:RNA polymerase sigma-70 factor (ECF subfamily)
LASAAIAAAPPPALTKVAALQAAFITAADKLNAAVNAELTRLLQIRIDGFNSRLTTMLAVRSTSGRRVDDAAPARRPLSVAPSDAELVARLAYDPSGVNLRTLYRRHADELYGFVYRGLGERGAAEEVVQDVFTAVWRHAQTYDHARGSVRTWMYRIARNALIDRRRRASVRPRLPRSADEFVDEPAELDESIEQAALRWQLAAALERLTPAHREVVRLAHYDGMTMRDIAASKDLPVGTIKSRAWYAMQSLRLALAETEAAAGTTRRTSGT